MALTIDDVLRELPRAPVTTKVASPSIEGPVTYGGLTRKLAELLRNVPEPEVSWTSLYAVKAAGYRSSPPRAATHATAVNESLPGAPLRKLANAVRDQENVRAVSFFQKNASALKAIRGLTLLREQVSR
jgi:hypothetical protein